MSHRFIICSTILLLFAGASLGGVVLPMDIDVFWCGGEWGSWMDGDNWCDNILWVCDPPQSPCRPYQWPDNNDTLSFYVSIDSNDAGVERVHVTWEGSYGPTVSEIEFRGDVHLLKWGGPWNELIVVEPNGFLNYGDLRVEIDVRGDIVNTSGSAIVFSGHLNVFGDLYNEAGALVRVSRDDIDIEDGAVHNAGQIWLASNGGIGEGHLFSNTGTIRLFNGMCNGKAVVNWQEGLIKGSGFVTSNEGLWNLGTIEAAGGSLLLYVEDGKLMNVGKLINNPGASLNITPTEDFNNAGMIEVNRDGAVTADCNLVNEPNGHISLLGGTLSADCIIQEDDAVLSGFGGITGDVVINPNGSIQLTGPTSIVGDVEINPNATLEVSDGTTLITGHTTCNNGTIRMVGGRVIFQGGLTNNNCNIFPEPGLYTNMADYNLDGKVNSKDFAYFANVWLWQAEL